MLSMERKKDNVQKEMLAASATMTVRVGRKQNLFDVCSRCKIVRNMATKKSDDELIQHDKKMRIGTRSGKFRKMENPELSLDWWQSMTRTPMTTSMIA